MQYPTFALLGLASTALAVPQVGMSGVPKFSDKFGLQASGSNIPAAYNQVTASRGRLWVGGEQSPVCEGGQRADFATFVWYSDKTVFLYKSGNPPQQVWVDDAGPNGVGLTGYETVGTKTKPASARNEGFEINADGALTFNGAGPRACPVEQGKWSIQFRPSLAFPAHDNCVDITLTAYKADARVACTYSDPVQV